MLNQICDIITKLQNQEKHIILCNVSAHIKIKGNEKIQAKNIPGMTATILNYTDHCLTSGGL